MCLADDAAAAKEDSVSGEAALSVMSAYIWRGQELTRHSIVMQPSATISYKGFYATAWANIDTRPYSAIDEKHSANLTEADITLSYFRKFWLINAGVGYIYYALNAPYSGAADPLDSQELFVSVGLDTLLSPTLTVYKEIDHYHQWYILLGVSHTFQFNDMIGLKLAGSVSYLKSEDASMYPKYDSNALATDKKYNNFHDGTFSVALPLTLTKRLTVTPALTYVFALSDDARYEMKGRGLQGRLNPSDRRDSFLYGGITASFAF
jgi:hypothetical protein